MLVKQLNNRHITGLRYSNTLSRNVFPQRNIFKINLGNQIRLFSESTADKDTFLPVPEVTDRIITVLKAFDKVDASKVTDKAHFTNDLGLDSLDAVEAIMAIEEEFVIEIPDDVAEKLVSVADTIKFISEHPHAK